MFSSPFLPLPAGLAIATTSMRDDLLVVQVVSTKVRSCCPLCFCPAERRHSHYTRVVADLPCAGLRVQLILHVRRFFCDNSDCIRKIFTERLLAFVLPWARLTVRLCEALQSLGLATCGEVGTRLAARLAIQTSPTTILRRLMTLPLDLIKSVVHLGIDDFALRRGRKYGTVLVDLQRHQVIDLLPDRTVETVSAWLQDHPSIEIISRDGSSEFASAIKKGAPQAREVSDRWHLGKNLSQCILILLANALAELRQAEQEKAASQEGGRTRQKTRRQGETAAVQQAQRVRQTERTQRYEQILALRSQGMGTAEIAAQMNMPARTIRHWLARGSAPDFRHRWSRVPAHLSGPTVRSSCNVGSRDAAMFPN